MRVRGLNGESIFSSFVVTKLKYISCRCLSCVCAVDDVFLPFQLGWAWLRGWKSFNIDYISLKNKLFCVSSEGLSVWVMSDGCNGKGIKIKWKTVMCARACKLENQSCVCCHNFKLTFFMCASRRNLLQHLIISEIASHGISLSVSLFYVRIVVKNFHFKWN